MTGLQYLELVLHSDQMAGTFDFLLLPEVYDLFALFDFNNSFGLFRLCLLRIFTNDHPQAS